MQERFREVKFEIDRIESTSPRIERDKRFKDLSPREYEEFRALIKKHEIGLAELKVEYGTLARSLGSVSLSAR